MFNGRWLVTVTSLLSNIYINQEYITVINFNEFFNSYSMLANIYIWTAIGRLRQPSSIKVYSYSIYYVLCSLASLCTNACNLYTIYTSIRHEPVMLLMLHAVSLDRSMKIVLKEGEGITIK